MGQVTRYYCDGCGDDSDSKHNFASASIYQAALAKSISPIFDRDRHYIYCTRCVMELVDNILRFNRDMKELRKND